MRAAWEAGGTFAMVLVGCGVASAGNALLTSFAFGAVVGLAVWQIGPRSGAHINPAVTLALALAGRFPWRDVPGYLASQFVGATVAGFVLLAIFHRVPGQTGPAVPDGWGVAIEALATAWLVAVVFLARWPAVTIGIAVTIGSLVAGEWTGAAMNPARALGPAIAAGQVGNIWIYIVGPIVGAAGVAWALKGRPFAGVGA